MNLNFIQELSHQNYQKVVPVQQKDAEDIYPLPLTFEQIDKALAHVVLPENVAGPERVLHPRYSLRNVEEWNQLTMQESVWQEH